MLAEQAGTMEAQLSELRQEFMAAGEGRDVALKTVAGLEEQNTRLLDQVSALESRCASMASQIATQRGELTKYEERALRWRDFAAAHLVKVVHEWLLDVAVRLLYNWQLGATCDALNKESRNEADRARRQALTTMLGVWKRWFRRVIGALVKVWQVRTLQASHVGASFHAAALLLNSVLVDIKRDGLRAVFQMLESSWLHHGDYNRRLSTLIRVLKPLVRSWMLRRRMRVLVGMARTSKCKDLSRLQTRIHVVREIINTEDRYVKTLHEMLVLFLLPVRDMIFRSDLTPICLISDAYVR